MRNLITFFTFITLATTIGCSDMPPDYSDSESNSETGSNVITTAFLQVATSTKALSKLSPAGTNKKTISFTDPAWWTDTTAIANEVSGVGTTSVKKWLGHQIDQTSFRVKDDSPTSVLGRIKENLGIFCAIGVSLGGFDGYPSDSDGEFKITQDLSTDISDECDFTSISDEIGSTISFSFGTPDSLIYDKVISFKTFQGGNQTIYFRVNGLDVNLASIETYTANSISQINRILIQISNGVMKAEFMNSPSMTYINGTSLEFSRMIHDKTNDAAYLMSMISEKNSGIDYYTQYIISGKPETYLSVVNLSIQSNTFRSWTETEHKICVDPSTGYQSGPDETYCSDPANSTSGISVLNNSVFGVLRNSFDGTKFDSISLTKSLSFTSLNLSKVEFVTE